MINELEFYKHQVTKLESELEELTVALSQAWDQLTPLLQGTPEQTNSLQDIMPVLQSIMTAISANSVAVFMLETDECYSIPADIHFTADLLNRLHSLDPCSPPFQIELCSKHTMNTQNWLFAPIIAEQKVVGAIGVGMNIEQRLFTSIDVRILERMAERTASQILAAHLAQSRQRELLTIRELEIANLIQRSIQPVKTPYASEIQVAVHWQPAKSVGGDAWGWVKRSNGEIGCFVLDVAGKGLPAALAAVSLHTAIQLALRLDLSAGEVIQQINEEFYEVYSRSDLLATVCVMVIDPIKRRIQQANAGHLPTLIHTNGEWTRWGATVPPIGTLPTVESIVQDIQLNSGDIILCYSDGFTEIENENGFWGEEGLLAAVPPNSHDVDAIVHDVVQAAERIRESRPMHDDQTLVAIHMTE